MNVSQPAALNPTSVLHLLRQYWKRWLLPAVVIAAAATVYALVGPATWEASQALMVRNQASNAERSPGKFSDPDEMKTVQETVLEVAKSRSVLRAALGEVGPPADCRDAAAWPSERDVVEARDNIHLVPPKGAEFGKTEVFYLNIRSADRQRSVTLNEAIVRQLQTHFQQLRDAKAKSMVEELTKTVALARADLDRATSALQSTEKRVGSDLAELRSMQDMAAGDSALRRSSEEIRGQLRESVLADKTDRQLLDVLAEAEHDSGRLVALPNRLLDSHPALRRLKEGLVDAQLRTSTLLGTMSAGHPNVRNAKEAEKEIGRTLHRELAIARRGIEVDLSVLADRRKLLQEQLAKSDARLVNLAAVRATYSNEVAETKNRAALLERAEQNLAEARATRASAKAASLISRIDTPDAGIRPLGPSRATIAICGVLGGLLAGFGLVFFSVPTVAPTAATPSVHTNGHRNGYFAAKSDVASNGHLSVNRALRKLGH
jgi:uncharacterized protein involved in exopolysaccharide biosynthesis